MLRFVQVCDPHFGRPATPGRPARQSALMAAAARRIADLRAEFVLFAGDLTEDGRPEQAAEFRAAAAALAVPGHVLPGNHDIGNSPTPGSVAAWRGAFEPLWSAFAVGDCAVVGFTSMLGGHPAVADLAERQLAELAGLFDAHADRPVRIVWTHVPLFVDSPDEPGSKWNTAPDYRRRLLGLLERFRPLACLSGHLHRNHGVFHAGVLHQTTTALGFQLGGDRPGIRLWRTGPSGISSRFVPVEDGVTGMPTAEG